MKTGRLLALALCLAAPAAPGRALATAERVLSDRMRAAGLERVEATEDRGSVVRGHLPGEGGSTVLLFAGCGPAGEASRDVALLAVADLARTPRRHTLQVVACAGGGAAPGAAERAAAGWLALHPLAAERDGVLAALHLEVDGQGGSRAVGLMQAGDGSRGRRLPPAWLAHAVLGGARAAGGELAIGDRRWPLMGQLLGRHGRLRAASGAGPFLAAGVPALTLAGGGPESRWPALVAAAVRRIDSLAGRPREDDVYLVLAGRVWSRRDLYWAGLAIFVALVATGLPGAWRGAGSGQRRRRGRRYLPGFLFRMVFLAALLLAPATTQAMLAPAALLTLLPPRRMVVVVAARLLAALPAALFGGYWAVALVAGRVALWPAQPFRLALVIGGVALAVTLVGRPRRGESPRAAG